jgi:hypothetical protein
VVAVVVIFAYNNVQSFVQDILFVSFADTYTQLLYCWIDIQPQLVGILFVLTKQLILYLVFGLTNIFLLLIYVQYILSCVYTLATQVVFVVDNFSVNSQVLFIALSNSKLVQEAKLIA